MHTNSTDAPLLGRCKTKGCDYAIFATRADVKQADNFKEVVAGTGVYRVGINGHFARCSNGHKFFPVKAIKGTYSKDHKCDARCLNAKGVECTCSCGGANHGAGHAVTVVEASAAPSLAMASEKQETFIRRLLDEKVIPASADQSGEQRTTTAITKLDAHTFTKRQASATITWLLTLPNEENN